MQSDLWLAKLSPDALHSVATIHTRAFPKSALTQLGNEAVRRYYEWQLVGPHEAVALGAWSKDRLIGFCIGGVFRGALSGFIRRNRAYLARCIAVHPWVLLDPMFRSRLLPGFRALGLLRKSMKTEPLQQTISRDRSFGILAIAVDPAVQRAGIGKLLLVEAERIAIRQGFPTMHLTVQANNHQAICFYEKMGWNKRKASGVWNGGMTKRLSSV